MSDDNIRTIGGNKNNTQNEQEEPTQLNKYKNVKMYLNKTVGKKWLFAYINDDDQIVYFPNLELNPSDTVFLAEFVKTAIFSTAMVVDGEEF